MNRNPLASFLRMLFNRKTPAVVGGIVLFVVLLGLEGVRVTQWLSTIAPVFTPPLVGSVTSTTQPSDDSGLKRSAPMIEIAPFRLPFTTQDTVLTQEAKDKSLPRTTPPDGVTITIPDTAGVPPVQPADSITGESQASTTVANDDGTVRLTDVTTAPLQDPSPVVVPPALPQAPAIEAPSVPPVQPQAVQPPPLPTATTVPLPTLVPTEVPPIPTEVPPPAPTEVPLPPPSPPQSENDDDNNGDDDSDNDDGDDDNNDDDGNNDDENDDDDDGDDD